MVDLTISERKRLNASFIPEPNTGCWIWLGQITWNGYGTFHIKVDGEWKKKVAHRVCYESFVGPIPEGLDLDHKCRQRHCVNPDHLEPVTRSENLRRSPLMARWAHKTSCPKGHPYDGVDSRKARICRQCAREARLRYNRKLSEESPKGATKSELRAMLAQIAQNTAG